MIITCNGKILSEKNIMVDRLTIEKVNHYITLLSKTESILSDLSADMSILLSGILQTEIKAGKFPVIPLGIDYIIVARVIGETLSGLDSLPDGSKIEFYLVRQSAG